MTIDDNPKSALVRNVGQAVIQHLEEISAMFVPEMKMTFIARHPSSDTGDMFVSNDTDEGITAVLQRNKKGLNRDFK